MFQQADYHTSLEETPGPMDPSREATISTVPSERLRNIEALVDRLHRMTQSLTLQSTAPASPTGSRTGGRGAEVDQPSISPISRTSTGQMSPDTRSIESSLFNTIREDAAQLHQLLSQPVDTSSSSEATRDSSSSRPVTFVHETPGLVEPVTDFNPMLDSSMGPPNIDWAYIDEFFSEMQYPTEPGPAPEEDDGDNR